MNTPASVLAGLNGERVALCDVEVSASLRDLLADVTVAQIYRNEEQVNIEAVYTFPLPLDAVLLDLRVDIGGRVLQGVVVEKKAAEKQYEDALEAGDAAVMLEEIEPGLFTMNVGNLLPAETAEITFRYALLYKWTDDRLRVLLPTTIAPRFGESPHMPHEVPETSLTVENQFSLRVEIFGALRNAQFSCPSHTVAMASSPEKAVLSLQQSKAVMDRDFILNVRAPQATRSFIRCGQDGEGTTAIASFQPFFPGLKQPRPLALAIVVDCSGSMQGDSMNQAKQALDAILERLQPDDRVTLVAFGSDTKTLSDRLFSCNKTNLAKARGFANALEANMGGTEVGNALRSAYAAIGRVEAADVFLVTDGEISNWKTVVDEAKKSRHRIFTVGVGSAVSEAFVRGLATDTGGECELVSPREGMADRVVRHFDRMRAPRARRVAVLWPAGASDLSPKQIGAVFEGDTVVACASFARPGLSGSVVLEIETEDGEVVRQELALQSSASRPCPGGLSTEARVAAALRLKEVDDGVGLRTALRYRLLSPWTNWLVVVDREEKSTESPELRKVPQTFVAGWGGTGTVVDACRVDVCAAPPMRFSRGVSSLPAVEYLEDFAAAADLDLPDFHPVPSTLGTDLPEPYRGMLRLVADDAVRADIGSAMETLMQSGVLATFDDLLRMGVDLGLDVSLVATIIIAGLLDGPLACLISRAEADATAVLRDLAGKAREAVEMDAGGDASECTVAVRDLLEEIDRKSSLLGGLFSFD